MMVKDKRQRTKTVRLHRAISHEAVNVPASVGGQVTVLELPANKADQLIELGAAQESGDAVSWPPQSIGVADDNVPAE